MTMTRRMALASGAALPLATLAPLAASAQTAPAAEDTPRLSHRIEFGNMTINVLLGGEGAGTEPQKTFGLNASAEDFNELSEENFIPADRSFNNYAPVVIEVGDEVILFDTSVNPDSILAALASAGIAPDAITTLVITHMHGDHIGGMSADGTLTFPNAKLVTGQVEMDYWAQSGNETFESKVRPFMDDFRLISGDDEVVPGIKAIEAFGHTPGMLMFMLTNDEGNTLLVAADMTNHYVWSLARPEWEVRFDMDKPTAIATRQKVLAMLSEEKIPFIGYHMPFPSVGYVAETEDGFRFVPATYQFKLAAS
ncbi:MBL fold metallo-hydrolase [Falsirhodobacter sp. alg1]|uniref:MBL fold metallo-hydrolase n=1 Tax=Falsirhodobacter sp. alg1 TaxID=1472418 RepID=UPI0005EE707B|nr:MBL fold metallo-hydrolase [Falsirhodobacter sp. alg1]